MNSKVYIVRLAPLLYKPLAKKVARCNPKTVLDAGCGIGILSLEIKKILRGSDVTGVDIDAHSIKVAKNMAIRNDMQINFIRADIHKFKFQPTAYDAVVSKSAFCYWRDSEILLNKFVKSLKRGGRLYVMDVRRDALFPRLILMVGLSDLFDAKKGAFKDYIQRGKTMPEVREILTLAGIEKYKISKMFFGMYYLLEVGN
ncbi:MAG: class I SAM-dependent methyltransferase [archaeon]